MVYAEDWWTSQGRELEDALREKVERLVEATGSEDRALWQAYLVQKFGGLDFGVGLATPVPLPATPPPPPMIEEEEEDENWPPLCDPLELPARQDRRAPTIPQPVEAEVKLKLDPHRGDANFARMAVYLNRLRNERSLTWQQISNRIDLKCV